MATQCSSSSIMRVYGSVSELGSPILLPVSARGEGVRARERNWGHRAAQLQELTARWLHATQNDDEHSVALHHEELMRSVVHRVPTKVHHHQFQSRAPKVVQVVDLQA